MRDVLIIMITILLMFSLIALWPFPTHTARLMCSEGKIYAVILDGRRIVETIEIEQAFCDDHKEHV